MMFRNENTGAYYLWDGRFPCLIWWPDKRIEPTLNAGQDHWWDGAEPKDLTKEQIEFLNGIAANARKRVFQYKGNTGKFQVTARGTFVNE